MSSRNERIAIARIFRDLIKADKIIDSGEMECWQTLCKSYDLSDEDSSEATKMSLSEALEIIRKMEPGEKHRVLMSGREISLSDGFCHPAEALIMKAVDMCLAEDTEGLAEVISIPRANFNIDIATALYIESEFDPEVNEEIRSSYRYLQKEFQLAGLCLVYIPAIIDHYKRTPPELFRSILSFLSPSTSDEGIEGIYTELMHMTTAEFCKDLLCNKCGIVTLRNTYPALLIKIGNSTVGEMEYANYLRMEVGKDILESVQKWVDEYTAMLSGEVFTIDRTEERDSRFHYHGFYKQLLDIFLIRRNIRSRIILDPMKEDIRFPDLDISRLGFNRRERALYTLFLCYGPEGISFAPPRTPAEYGRYAGRIQQIQRRYEIAYEFYGGEKGNAPDLSEVEIRRPIISRIRGGLRKLKGLYNPDDYTILKEKNDRFAVHVDRSRVFVRASVTSEPIPLFESELFKRIKQT